MNINFKKFDKTQRSTFEYWFYHWLAFNWVAWNHGAWKPKWLLHDIEKPWLKLFWGDYKRVQKWHKYNNSHHIFSGRKHGYNKIDWLAAVIDWEASRYTKYAAPRTAREEVDFLVNDGYNGKFTIHERELAEFHCYPILEALGL